MKRQGLIIPLVLALTLTLIPLSSAKGADHEIFQSQVAAEHVLIGKVRNIESRWNDDRTSIYSYVTISVENWLTRACSDKEITVKYIGGEVGDVGCWVSDQASFSMDDCVKVFLRLEETGEFTVMGGGQGKISLSNPASLGYSYSGVHWHSSSLPVKYYINELGTPDTTDEFMAVQKAFQTWEDDPGSNMDYTYMGTTTRSGDVYDGYNVVSWGNIDGSGGKLAECIGWYYPSSKELIEFDIVFDEAETWSLPQFDVQNVGTHETGHTLRLLDLYDSADSEETMYGYSSPGETKKRTLHTGDMAGIRYIYPAPMVTYTIATNPTGLQIEVDGNSYTTPRSFNWNPQTTHTINAPSPQSGATGVRYLYTSWSDGGTQSHTITVGASDITITATYKTQFYLTVSSLYGVTSGAGWYDKGSTAYARLDAGIIGGATETRYVFTSWSGDASGVDYARSNPITMNAPKTAMANWKTQCQITFTDSGIGGDTGSMTILTINGINYAQGQFSYTSWYDSGSTIDYASADSVSSTSTGKRYVWTSTSGLGQTGRTGSFTATQGGTMTVSYRIQYYVTLKSDPSEIGDPRSSGWYDGGSTVSITATAPSPDAGKRYVWKGWIGSGTGSYTGKDNPATIIMNGPISETAYWTRQLLISFVFKTNDGTENLYKNPASVKIYSSPPNSTLITLSSYPNIWLDDVQWTVKQVLWQDTNVVPDPNPQHSPTPGGTWTINCRVYFTDFTSSFKDSHGVALYTSPPSFRIVCPNGTTTSALPAGSYYLQNGTYQLRTVVWRGIDVSPSPSPTFDPAYGSPVVNCRVYPLTVYVKDYLTLAVSGADVGIYLPNGTLFNSEKSGAGGEIVFSQLPTSDYKVEVDFLGLKTSAALSLNSDKNVEIRTLLSIPILVIMLMVVSISIGGILYLKKRR